VKLGAFSPLRTYDVGLLLLSSFITNKDSPGPLAVKEQKKFPIELVEF
jgi:hypothetical protein